MKIEGECNIDAIIDGIWGDLTEELPPSSIPGQQMSIKYGGGLFLESELKIRPNTREYKYEWKLILRLYIKFLDEATNVEIEEFKYPEEDYIIKESDPNQEWNTY